MLGLPACGDSPRRSSNPLLDTVRVVPVSFPPGTAFSPSVLSLPSLAPVFCYPTKDEAQFPPVTIAERARCLVQGIHSWSHVHRPDALRHIAPSFFLSWVLFPLRFCFVVWLVLWLRVCFAFWVLLVSVFSLVFVLFLVFGFALCI